MARVAAHIAAAEWGGAERRSLILLAGLAQRGHEVIVYCNAPHIAERAREQGLHAHIRPLRGDAVLSDAVFLALALRRQRADVLIVITFKRLWLAALAAKLAGTRRVIARVGLASDVARRTKYRFVLKRWVSDVVLNAHSLLEPFRASLARKSRVRLHVIPNGVDMPPGDATRDDIRNALDIPQQAFVVGTVARLVAQKRIDRLLGAVARDGESFAVITGDGPLRAELETHAQRLGIADRVRFTGQRGDVGTIHRTLDTYVVTSSQEGMSNAMLEALASGLPVISTRVSGAEEVLRDPPCGIVTGDSVEEVAAAIRTLRDNADLRSTYAANAHDVARRYDVATMIDAWDRLLDGT